MFQIEVANVICTIKEALLEQGQLGDGSYKALVISADLGMDDYESGETKRGVVHFIFSGNTSVWFAHVDALSRWDSVLIDEWENTSNHDSCWRTDGVSSILSKLYFKWAKEINPDMAPCDLSKFCTLGVLFSSPWEKIRVIHKKSDEDHRRVLTNIKKGW